MHAKPGEAIAAFEQILATETDACLEWPFARDKDGYGIYHVNRVKCRAHREIFRRTTGRLCEQVRHTCDNPPCCNKRHLLEGDAQSNSDDKFNRGRARLGSKHHNAILSEEDVMRIREVYVPRHRLYGQHALARHYGVSQLAICQVVNRTGWKHV